VISLKMSGFPPNDQRKYGRRLKRSFLLSRNGLKQTLEVLNSHYVTMAGKLATTDEIFNVEMLPPDNNDSFVFRRTTTQYF